MRDRLGQHIRQAEYMDQQGNVYDIKKYGRGQYHVLVNVRGARIPLTQSLARRIVRLDDPTSLADHLAEQVKYRKAVNEPTARIPFPPTAERTLQEKRAGKLRSRPSSSRGITEVDSPFAPA